MAELMRSLPANHPQRMRILAGFRKMMESLLKFQRKDGMWLQLLDHPEAWPETVGLIKYFDANANLREVCEGTNKKNDLAYYLNRGRNVGDLHGQAPLLWSASALLR